MTSSGLAVREQFLFAIRYIAVHVTISSIWTNTILGDYLENAACTYILIILKSKINLNAKVFEYKTFEFLPGMICYITLRIMRLLNILSSSTKATDNDIASILFGNENDRVSI